MALFKPGPLIAAISGTVGGANFLASGKQSIVRIARRRPSQSAFNLGPPRAHLKRITAAWTALTAAQHANWATEAAQLRWPDRLGTVRPPTDRYYFFSHNLQLLTAGQTPDFTTPPLALDTNFITSPQITISGASTLTYFANSGIGPLFFGISLYIQPFYRNMENHRPAIGSIPLGHIPQNWKFCKWILATSGGSTNLYPDAAPIIGNIAVGQYVAVKATFVQSGYSSTWTAQGIAKRP